MKSSADSLFGQPYRCRDCGSELGFRSRRRTMYERFVQPLTFRQPVRCGECFRRDARWIFTPVHDRLPEPPRTIPSKSTAASNRNVA